VRSAASFSREAQSQFPQESESAASESEHLSLLGFSKGEQEQEPWARAVLSKPMLSSGKIL